MRSNFARQLEPCAWNGITMRATPVERGSFSPPIPRPTCDKFAPERILEHETQEAFLKRLIAYEDGEASIQLQNSLAKADRENKRIRHAMLLMVTIFLLSLVGLGVCAALLPQIFSNPTHFVIKSLGFLGLASLISQIELFGYLLWKRFAVNHLHKECRRRVLLLVESRLGASLRKSLGVDASEEPGSTLARAPVQQTARSSPELPDYESTASAAY